GGCHVEQSETCQSVVLLRWTSDQSFFTSLRLTLTRRLGAIPRSRSGERQARNGRPLGAGPLPNGSAQFFRGFASFCQRARFWKLRPASGGGLTTSKIIANSCGLLIAPLSALKRVSGVSRLIRACAVT